MFGTINNQIAKAQQRIKNLQQLKLKNRYKGKYLILANVFSKARDDDSLKPSYQTHYRYYLNPFLIMKKLCKSEQFRKDIKRYAKATDNTKNLYILYERLIHNAEIKRIFMSDKNIGYAQLHLRYVYFQVSLHDLGFKPYAYNDILFDKDDVKSLVSVAPDKTQRAILENGVVGIDKAKTDIIKLILKQHKERQLY